MNTDRLIQEKKAHREYLEVEATILYNSPELDQSKAKLLADVITADILRISAEIMDLQSGIEITINEESFAAMANKYYFLKLKETEESKKRLSLISDGNFWGLLRRAMKGKK